MSSSTASARVTRSDAARQDPAPSVRQAPAHVVEGFEHIDAEKCRSFERSAELVGRKWTAGIMLAGMLGARRFVEYRGHVEGISGRLLTQRLRELELEGLLEREVIATKPVQITYRPTERGIGLMRALHPLITWSVADQHLAEASHQPAASER
ncbi:hypothetical protein GCM10010413_37000 [Promicromonospora sukumoe]|uniref:DNA-binding HxlR family transcriptional regulator n=1 Tax=Promicromonospora sukumoe TaxID=88382 RepID=A0A7W3J7C5_9MICO|nr:winged helix-turn-helix transcriptional regulator [Promicromonospora sukumoe]MBA8807640.1 DNA-binding HxlR family transcriptional regulator [Promicromonospora sukumoe]